MEQRKIPTKNYIIYGVIVVISLLFVFYLNEWFKAYKENELANSYIANYVSEVSYQEFENYIQENPNMIVYIGMKDSEECLSVEKKLYKIIEKYDLIEETVFLNVEDNNSSNLNSLKQKYYNQSLTTQIDNVPAIAIVTNKKIVDIVVSDKDGNIERGDIIGLLEGQELIND